MFAKFSTVRIESSVTHALGRAVMARSAPGHRDLVRDLTSQPNSNRRQDESGPEGYRRIGNIDIDVSDIETWLSTPGVNMKFNELRDTAFDIWKTGYEAGASTPLSLTVLGKPGIGKSACAAATANSIARHLGRVDGDGKAKVVNLTATPDFNGNVADVVLFYAADLSSFLPEDLGGIPKSIEANVCGKVMSVASYAIQRWLAPFCVPGAQGVLCLDDLPAAAPAVQVAVRQLVLDRRIGQNKLADGIMLFITGNRREDKSNATALPAHFRNATCLVDIDTDVETWCDWYGASERAPIIAAFLRFRPSHHARTPKDADNRGAFATPRSWAMLGNLYKVATARGNLLDIASGLVGEGVATELLAFINVRNALIDPASVLLDPVKALPDVKGMLNTPDKAYAMTTGLGEVAAAWRKGSDKKLKEQAPYLFLRAVGHVTQRDREYIATAVQTYVSNTQTEKSGGDIQSIVKAAKDHREDPLVRSVLEFLASTFNKRS